jgi:hypothetical protein
MSYPTVEEFKTLLRTSDLLQIAEDHILTGLPYAFKDHPRSMNIIQRHLTARLPLKSENIIVVGSARLGFSLNPDGYFNSFNDASDIDIIVIDADLFDMVWSTILDWHYPRKYTKLPESDWGWVGERKKDIYWGWIVPHAIRYKGLSLPSALKPIRDFKTSWFNAFQSFSLYDEFVSRTMNSRLYRTRDHALKYHVHGLRGLRDFILSHGVL